ncbi:hypothetical protein GWI33_009040 [Rhynchophorus ferrugineus]|uniref:Uncharacterized protein n=1 Tax=Rhynchophorus ferrugineus TaxID=354439 RepID=A0A834IFX7_RHYFE|nr:hypothetical protein GWI33_009040 [Rhynchophorus ferrugineus]
MITRQLTRPLYGKQTYETVDPATPPESFTANSPYESHSAGGGGGGGSKQGQARLGPTRAETERSVSGDETNR